MLIEQSYKEEVTRPSQHSQITLQLCATFLWNISKHWTRYLYVQGPRAEKMVIEQSY